MAKVNHRDTLDSQLRELQRRLRLLEARHTPPTAAAAVAQFRPARPADWWQLSDTPDWTDLASATVPAAAQTLRLQADGPGDVRVQVDGQPDAEYPAGEHVIPLPDTAGTVRVQGRGTVRVFATLE
jgi:hypothetical protein